MSLRNAIRDAIDDALTSSDPCACADAALSVTREHVDKMQGGYEWANGEPASAEGFGYNRAIEDVLALLGVAPTTPEPPMPFYGGGTLSRVPPSLPSHDQEQP